MPVLIYIRLSDGFPLLFFGYRSCLYWFINMADRAGDRILDLRLQILDLKPDSENKFENMLTDIGKSAILNLKSEISLLFTLK